MSAGRERRDQTGDESCFDVRTPRSRRSCRRTRWRRSSRRLSRARWPTTTSAACGPRAASRPHRRPAPVSFPRSQIRTVESVLKSHWRARLSSRDRPHLDTLNHSLIMQVGIQVSTTGGRRTPGLARRSAAHRVTSPSVGRRVRRTSRLPRCSRPCTIASRSRPSSPRAISASRRWFSSSRRLFSGDVFSLFFGKRGERPFWWNARHSREISERPRGWRSLRLSLSLSLGSTYERAFRSVRPPSSPLSRDRLPFLGPLRAGRYRSGRAAAAPSTDPSAWPTCAST